MRPAVLLIALCVLVACGHAPKPRVAQKNPAKKTVRGPKGDSVKKIPDVKYTEPELLAFMDSIKRLPIKQLKDSVSLFADSIKNSMTTPMSRRLTPDDFAKLKKAAHKGQISASDAKHILGELLVDSNNNDDYRSANAPKGFVELQFFSFEKDTAQFNKFAIRVGHPEHSDGVEIYFFNGDKIIAKQNGYSNYPDDIDYLLAPNGDPIIYRLVGFDHGSGIWWMQWYFFKYDGDKLAPVLTELQNGNMQEGWGARSLWLESKVINKSPLTIKMVYYQQLYQFADSNGFKEGPYVVNDSTIVRYHWDEKTKTLRGQFDGTGITADQMLTYNLRDNEFLFINTYYSRLKTLLNSKQKHWVLNYLNEIKNYEERVKRSKKQQ